MGKTQACGVVKIKVFDKCDGANRNLGVRNAWDGGKRRGVCGDARIDGCGEIGGLRVIMEWRV